MCCYARHMNYSWAKGHRVKESSFQCLVFHRRNPHGWPCPCPCLSVCTLYRVVCIVIISSAGYYHTYPVNFILIARAYFMYKVDFWFRFYDTQELCKWLESQINSCCGQSWAQWRRRPKKGTNQHTVQKSWTGCLFLRDWGKYSVAPYPRLWAQKQNKTTVMNSDCWTLTSLKSFLMISHLRKFI